MPGGTCRFGAVDEDPLARIAEQLERFEVERDVADHWVVEALHAGAVQLDVVGGPASAEVDAASGELADQIGEPLVVWIATSFGAQDADGVVGDRVPVEEELGGPWVEEQESGGVDGPRRVVEQQGVERPAELVGGEDVEPPVAHEGRGPGEGVEDPLHDGPHPRLRRPPRLAAGPGVERAGEIEEVHPLDLVELQRHGDAVEDVVGDAAEVPPFEPDVVLVADPGEQRHFLAAQPGNPPIAAIDGKPRLLRCDPPTPGRQELADVVPGVHLMHVIAASTGGGRPCQYPS